MIQRSIALVTGANKGIGRETVGALGKLGMTVLVGARDRGRGEAAVASLRAGDVDARLLLLDVADPASIASAARWVEAELGRLDVLVNNAGIARPGLPSEPLSSTQLMFDTNFFGAVAVTRALLPLLRRAPAARIVNMSSSLGSLALAADPTTAVAQQNLFFAYASTKTALNGFTVRLATELRDTPIKVNSACPGFVATDLNQHRGIRTAIEGARIAVHLATLPADGPTGGFFNDAGPVPW
jgi:NAD(P)-dependent dehydrogenase (short-subunit alcohol dehydrogenase family)